MCSTTSHPPECRSPFSADIDEQRHSRASRQRFATDLLVAWQSMIRSRSRSVVGDPLLRPDLPFRPNGERLLCLDPIECPRKTWQDRDAAHRTVAGKIRDGDPRSTREVRPHLNRVRATGLCGEGQVEIGAAGLHDEIGRRNGGSTLAFSLPPLALRSRLFMKIKLCDHSYAEPIREILNDAILNSTALYDYKPRTPEMMTNWFAAKRAGNFPVIGALADDG